MGADKAFVLLDGVTLAQRVIDRLSPQVTRLAISSNAQPDALAGFGLPVLADTLPGQPGPLAGILAGMLWAQREAPQTSHLLSAPVDTPFLPADLAGQLATGAGGGVAVASSGGKAHPVIALWPVKLAERLETFLKTDGRRSVLAFAEAVGHAEVRFSGDPDPFLNINTPEELATAETLLRNMKSGPNVIRP